MKILNINTNDQVIVDFPGCICIYILNFIYIYIYRFKWINLKTVKQLLGVSRSVAIETLLHGN